ncbi:YpfB family protein [Metabacillus lacus]|uniref:YpfB family protein n=1 Tax=Metabacillus lacus TaxID=1983721 RepID=UPI001479234E|nr:YpfB family protein [Metabacillus lacus]
MPRLEKLLIKIIAVQLVCLIIVQILIQQEAVSPYLSKVVQYEGVNKMTVTEWLETFKQ